MVGPILKESIIFIVFCHIFVSGKDILEAFRPNPSLPQELNDWLAAVQKYKSDFRLIREVASAIKDKRSSETQYEDDDDEAFEEQAFDRFNIRNQPQDLDEQPKNDIYPYMYKNKPADILDSNSFRSPEDNKQYNSINLRSPLRLRRDLNLFDDENPVKVQSKGKSGEIKRSGSKYPNKYINKDDFSAENNANLKNNFKEGEDNSKVDDEVKKREIQIDIRNNGKLIKQITENGKNPRPILLNIQAQGKDSLVKDNHIEKLARNSQPNLSTSVQNIRNNVKNSNVKNSNVKNSNVKENKKPVHINFEGLPFDNKDFAPVRSVKTEPFQTDRIESLNNFNNLFAVNERLNTDHSLLRDATNELVYRITFPQYGTFPDNYEYSTPPMQNIEINNKKHQKFQLNPLGNISNFNRNNLQDMSNFWTDSEKNRMRQGIEFARNTENFKRFPQKVNEQSVEPVKENETGFEPAQRIELEHDNAIEISEHIPDPLKDFHSRNKKHMVEMNTDNNIPNIEGPPEQNDNRELEWVEDKRQLVDKDEFGLNKYDPNDNNFDEGSAVFVSPVDSGGPARFEKMHTIDMSTDVVVIGGDKFMDGNLDSLSNENQVGVADSLNDRENDPGVPLENSLNDIEPPVESNQLACGLASVGLKDSMDNSNVEELSDVGMDKMGMDNMEVDNMGEDCEIPECHHDLHTNVHSHQVHKYITKTESITEVDEYPNEEENENNHQPMGDENDDPCVGNEHIPRHHHRDVKVLSSFRKQGNHGRAHKSPDSDKVVFTRDGQRYGYIGNNRKYGDSKTPRFTYGNNGNNEIVDYRNGVREPHSFSLLNRKMGKKRSNRNHLFAAGPLMMSRRYNFNDRNIKGYRGNVNSRLNNFETLLSNNHGNYLNRNNEDSYYGNPKSQADFIPAFIGRKLNAVEYAYDAYMDVPGENSFDEISTELQDAVLEDRGHAELLHKNSVEGDYGDEEDSITEKNKKKSYSITKKTENEFANPRTTTETDYDDDYIEDYDNKDSKSEDSIISSTMESNKKKQTSRVNERMPVPQRGSEHNIEKNKELSELKDTNINSFAHHLHKKYNPFQKITRKHGMPAVKGNKAGIKDETSSNNDLKRTPRRNSPGKRQKRNRAPNAGFVDRNSDFQHWPSFVISDNENEETLKKRSLIMKKKNPRASNNFPMASKDFFVKQQGQQGNSNTKEKPADNPAPKIESYGPLNIEKRLPELTDNPNPSTATDAAVSSEPDNTNSDSDKDDTTETDNYESICKPNLTNICEQNENFNRTRGTELTTILAIIPDALQDVCDENSTIPKTFERLDEIINGDLPARLLSSLFSQIRREPKLKHRFIKGLTRTIKDISFINVNETNTETKKLINTMSNIINKLEFSTTCQSLPSYLTSYLKSITKVRRENVLDRTKEMDDVEFDEGQNENNFIFESVNRGGLDNLEEKVKILKELLTKFNNLPDRCKSRAKPVKEYIENHLGLLSNMEYGGGRKAKQMINTKPISNPKRTADIPWKDEDTLVQEQLASLGLGSQHNFKPKFNLDELIENRKYAKPTTSKGNQATPHPQKVNKRDIQSVSTSKQYNKLLDAVRKVRLRREGARRLGEMYAKSKRESSDYSEFHDDVKNTDTKYISRANFESPLVYSL